MKARRGTALSQREPDFRSTVDWTWVPSQVSCTITWPQSSGFLAVGIPDDFGVFRADQWRWGGTASRECLSGDASKTRNFLNSTHCLWEEDCKIGLICMGTTHKQSVVQITRTSYTWANTGVWTFVDWEFLLISLKKSVTTGVTWGVTRRRENAPLAFFYLRRVFLATDLKRGKYRKKKNFRISGGKGMCVH